MSYSTWDIETEWEEESNHQCWMCFMWLLSAPTDSHDDHDCVCEALRCVKELIAAVDSKVNEQEKKQRLKEVYRYTSLPTSYILYVGCAESQLECTVSSIPPNKNTSHSHQDSLK